MTRINMGESVRARLHNIAKVQGSDLDTLIVRFALERTLYRIGQSKYNKQFMLKGAMLFSLWYDMPHRPTRDMDLLGVGDTDLQVMKKTFQEIIALPCDDGIIFDVNSITVTRILEMTAYSGVKVTIDGTLAKARCKVSIDVGFGDAVTPGPVQSTYPTLIKDFPAPQLYTYPIYTVVAEKLHAITFHGVRNSRVKDYLDLFVILEREALDKNILSKAITATFARRGSIISAIPLIGLSDDFANDPSKQVIWRAFLKRNNLPEQSFPAVVKTLREKFQPLLNKINQE